MSLLDFKLSKEEKLWFDQRMEENQRGKVIVQNYCYVKFKKLANNNSLTNNEIKTWLINNVYNSKDLYLG